MDIWESCISFCPFASVEKVLGSEGLALWSIGIEETSIGWSCDHCLPNLQVISVAGFKPGNPRD